MKLHYRRWPCPTCPWRRDTAGRVRFDNLAVYAEGTCGRPGAEAPLGADMFACHASKSEHLCAGWLVVAGYDHLTVRLAIVKGVLPAEVLQALEGWPELFGSYEEMASAHAVTVLLESGEESGG